MRCLNNRRSVFEILKRPDGKSLESRLQAAERANSGARGTIQGRTTVSELWPAKAGTPNAALEFK